MLTDGESPGVAFYPVDACVLIHGYGMMTVKTREAVARMLSFPDKTKLQVTVVGSREIKELTTTVTNGTTDHTTAILEWVPASSNGPELSATFLNRGAEKCFTDPPTVAGTRAKILIIIGSFDTDVVGDIEPLLNKNTKTLVMNVTPGRRLLPSFRLLATDGNHVIDIADLASFSKILQIGSYTLSWF